jgi:hypothetical protein
MIFRATGSQIAVRFVPDEPLVRLTRRTDLKRFSRYWQRVERSALSA